MVATKTTTTVGIDIGSETTKVVLGPTYDCEIVRNEVGEHTTTTGITFGSSNDGKRLIGHSSNAKSSSFNKNTIIQLNRLLPNVINNNNDDEEDMFSKFYCFDMKKQNNDDVDNDNDDVIIAKNNFVTVNYKGGGDDGSETTEFDSSALLAMLLGNIKKNVNTTIKNRQKLLTNDELSSQSNNGICYVLSLPPGSSQAAYDALYDAAYAAGLVDNNIKSSAKVVNSALCTGEAYHRKFPESTEESQDDRYLMVIDMGHTQTCVSILRLGRGNKGSTTAKEDEEAVVSEEEETKKSNNNNNNDDNNKNNIVELISSKCNMCLGAGTIDIRLWEYFTSTVDKLKSLQSKPTSKKGQRLLNGCQKLKHLLSQLPDGTVTVENIGDDCDVTLKCNRDVLVDICKDDKDQFVRLINDCIKEANIESSAITNVEILGGGCRIPWVQQTILDTIQKKDLSKSLDDTSIALGAALLGTSTATATANTTNNDSSDNINDEEEKKNDDDNNDDDNAKDVKREKRRKRLLEAEKTMVELDTELAKKDDIRNKIESHVLEMRKAKYDNDKYAKLLPDSNTILDPYLNDIDDWLFSDDAIHATLDDMQRKLDETIQKTNELCSEYFAAIKKDEEIKNQQMEAEAAIAQAERDANADNNDDNDNDDHDNRRLPKKRRMEIVMKNKNEANELFGDGNYRHAAARYNKALTHCSKFVDLSPDDINEVNDVKLSLNLNLALAYMKLENYNQALRVCNDALSISDDKSIKALYRRSSIYYEKKQWDNANKDITKAIELSGGKDDKALTKLKTRIDYQIKKQQQKEKKMAQKMFG